MNNYRTLFDKTNKIWSGAGGTSLPQWDQKQSLGSALLNVLAKFPDKIGQISENNGIQMTNGEIRWRSIRAAQNLINLGIGFDDVIQVISKNHHYLAPIMFGALSIGAPINAIDVQFTKDEMVHMLQLAKPKLILCDLSVLDTLNGALKQLQMDRPIFAFDGSADGVQNVEVLFNETDVESFEPPPLIDANKHTAIIVCTSGTTGFPKGVCLSHISLMAKCIKTGISSDDVMLNFSSLYWLTGWATILMTTLNSATRIITTKPFTSEIWLDIVQRHKVTVTLTPPHFMALILQDPKLNTTDISSLKLFFCTGGMVSHDVCDRMNKRMPNGVVCVAYAMSETAGFISGNISALRPGSVGQLFPGFDAKIINDNGDQCGIGENGEIYFKPAYRFISYYGDEENTIKTMDSDGWIRTGDLGHFDDEGFLYLIDRQKEILKYFSSQVSPSELESVLMQHPGVGNVCVVGIPDDLAGDLPAAVIIKSATTDVTEDDINSLMKTKLSDVKQLRGGIYFVDELPVTPSGKVLRRKVQEIALKFRKERSAL
ncbi:4-coumarate--CoA ligase 1-like [Bradysia coprophila]|uniref:4-coumarate--CoA ligase 1-like n=1 Tax=Bradysia coprophila TaxID=38358 RepID=UPI00187DD29C|nr:4-coumarate--CoA ligase 1-like [Bradysia coprophila]